MKGSKTFFGDKVFLSDTNKLRSVRIPVFECSRLKMISDVLDVPFDEVLIIILNFGFERFEQEFNCSFGIMEVNHAN